MLNRLSFIILFVVTSFCSIAQTRALSGTVITEDLEPISGIKILGKDTILFGTTQNDGHFEISIPANASELVLAWIGLEWTTIKVNKGCNNLEIIMLKDVIYDYTSSKQRAKKRLKRFNDLPNKHQEAYRQGIFKKTTPCFEYVFTP